MRISLFGLIILSFLVLMNCETKKTDKLPNTTWSMKIEYIDYLEITKDSLFAVKALSKGVLQKILLDKSTGAIQDTVYSKYKQSEDKYAQFRRAKIDLYGCKGIESKQQIGPIETIVCRYYVTVGVNGDSIFIETKYKNIRSPDNVSHELIATKNSMIKQRFSLNALIYDYVVTDRALILYCSQDEAYSIKSFSLDNLMNFFSAESP